MRRTGLNGWYVPRGRCAADGSARALADFPQILSGAAVPDVPRLRERRVRDRIRFRREDAVTMSPRLSAIVIAKNEASNIEACLDSLAFCDERIVVDGGSEDGDREASPKEGRARHRRNGVAGLRPAEEFGAVACDAATGCCRSMPTSA